MMNKNEIEAMNIAFDFHKQYTIVNVPKSYDSAENFALNLVYSLRSYVADKLGIEVEKVVLIAVSENDKVVVISEDNRYQNWLWNLFHQPSVGVAQFYDNVAPSFIINRINDLCR